MKRLSLLFVLLFVGIELSAQGYASRNFSYDITEKSRTQDVFYRNQNEFSGVRFQSYIYLGTDFDSVLAGPSLDASFGVRIFKYAYVGLGVGWHNWISTSWTPYFPFTLDAKVYVPTVPGLYPHLDLKIGPWVDTYPDVGLYMHVGLGLDYKCFSFAAGYQLFELGGLGHLNMGYVNVGVRLGRR